MQPMNAIFPAISHLSDLLPHIKDNPQIRVKTDPNGMTIICYIAIILFLLIPRHSSADPLRSLYDVCHHRGQMALNIQEERLKGKTQEQQIAEILAAGLNDSVTQFSVHLIRRVFFEIDRSSAPFSVGAAFKMTCLGRVEREFGVKYDHRGNLLR